MLRKRISTLALVVMMGISVVGCQSSKEQQLENRVQQLEQQLEEQQPDKTEEVENKNLTVKEKREVEKAKEAGKQVKNSGKAADESTRKPRYWLGQYIGDYTDSEVAAMNKIIYDEIDKAIEKEFQNDDTNSDIDDRAEYEKEYQPKDHTGEDEDYWKTDGDIPETEQPEEQGTFNKNNTVHWKDEINGTDEYISNEEAQQRMDDIDKYNEQIQQQIEQSHEPAAQSNVESNIEESEKK